MTDPAIAAEQRARKAIGHVGERLPMVAAAREALKPIKQMWRREMGVDSESNVNERFQRIGRELARLIFTDDEMDGGSPGE